MKHYVVLGPEGEIVCERCEIADNFFTRLRGLLGREHLRRGEGMLIRPTRSIHTIGMQFPIDVVYLDRELSVLKIKRRLGCWRASICWRARSVLELPAGECERLGISVGDRLGWGVLRSAT